MPLAPGQTLSFYEILAPLGAGGMGEVWRARDTRLEREVAIKVLPESFAADEERLRRFEREARTLASLSHPNVAQIHGIDQVGDTCFLALELVPGEDLAARLARGPLAIEEALDVCRQIAEGLAAAHDAGVVHRDLKPANVCLAPDGTVKLLDFGLAKPSGGSSARPGSSTPARPDSFLVTEQGLVLGTPTYMSPEQARGRAVDRRTDAWAFGCVLYECLTGQRAFAGDAVADVLAAIVEREPDLARLPSATPRAVVELVRRCLVKDPRQRLQHLGEARITLERALREPEPPAAETPAAPRRAPAAALAAVAMLGLAVGSVVTWLAAPPRATVAPAVPARAARVSIPIPRISTGVYPRIAPDGRAIVYTADEPDGHGGRRKVLHLRRLDAMQPIRLPGTESPATMTFAPDGGSLVVVVRAEDESLRMVRVVLDEGAPRAVPIGPFAPDPQLSGAMTWTDSDLLVTTGNRKRLLVRPVDGGTWSEVPIGRDTPAEFDPEVFRALPGGTHVLANDFDYAAGGFVPVLLAIDVRTGEAKELVSGGFGALLENGLLLFARSDGLYAQELDLAAMATRGAPRLLFEGLRTAESWRPGWFDVARDGTLIHLPGGRQGGQRELVVVGSDGSVEPWSDERRAFDGQLEVAFDGSVLMAPLAAQSGLLEVWSSSVAAPLMRPLLAAPDADYFPGPIDTARGIVYFTRRSRDAGDGVWRAPLDAPDRAEPVWTPSREGIGASASELLPDGSTLLVRGTRASGVSLFALDVTAERPEPRLLFGIDSETHGVECSPDGQWLSYVSDLGGQRALLLRRLRPDGSVGPIVPVPRNDSGTPQAAVWSRAAGARPVLVSLLDDDSTFLEIELLDDAPTFAPARVRATIPGERVIDFASLPDGRLLAVLRGEQELAYDRIEVVLGGLTDPR